MSITSVSDHSYVPYVQEAGYNLDCLLTKYQGVDWRNSSFANCNKGMNPMWEGRYDGTSLNPLEQASHSMAANQPLSQLPTEPYQPLIIMVLHLVP